MNTKPIIWIKVNRYNFNPQELNELSERMVKKFYDYHVLVTNSLVDDFLDIEIITQRQINEDAFIDIKKQVKE